MALLSPLRRLTSNERGGALVEFAMLLPILLLLFGMTIEGARMMWSYQTAIAGVRDASRYLGRIVPTGICAPTSPSYSPSTYSVRLTSIVRDRIGGGSVLPAGVTLGSVTSSVTCVSGAYRISSVPVATVTAQVTITFPFASLIAYAGGNLGTITTTITDESRVFGS